MTNTAPPLIRTTTQALFLIVLATAIALGFNFLREGSLPLIGEWDVDARFSDGSGESMVIPLETAKALFEEQRVVFMDARPGDQYDVGHIQGAVSLPWHEADTRFMEVMPTIDPDAVIITYCDGETCELSHNLALYLKEMGFQVSVLVNGWTLWKESGLPIE